MGNAALVSLTVCLAVLVTGCVGSDRPVAVKASEKVIIAAMGHGLLGEALNTLSRQEKRQALEAEYKALEYTRARDTVRWSVSGNGASGNVTPGQPYQIGSLNCRHYSHSFTIGGAPQTTHGSACRNPDGSWTPL